jgi:hypothetical protein
MAIRYTLQMITSVLIALEVSQPPNPYKTHLIVCLSLIIALKYDLPSKIINSLENLYSKTIKLFKL